MPRTVANLTQQNSYTTRRGRVRGAAEQAATTP